MSVLDAIEAERRAHYGAQVPMHYGTVMPWQDGGPDPLRSVSIYTHPTGHWHYVALGMSELDEKQTPNPAVSGWGFELTFRLRAPAETPAAEAPTWPIVLLNDVARYVFESRRTLAHGHFLERPGDPRGQYWGLLRDRELRAVETANGRFEWLQLVKLDEAQFRRLQGDDYEGFIAELVQEHPLLLT